MTAVKVLSAARFRLNGIGNARYWEVREGGYLYITYSMVIINSERINYLWILVSKLGLNKADLNRNVKLPVDDSFS